MRYANASETTRENVRNIKHPLYKPIKNYNFSLGPSRFPEGDAKPKIIRFATQPRGYALDQWSPTFLAIRTT